MTLGEMRALLAAEGIRLTRSLGQSFLHDANQLRRIVDLAEIRPGERVLEIGPGLGPLTEVLLAAGAQVLAIEKDRRLATILARRLDGRARFELITADALDWIRETRPDLADWKLVSNLPYSVGSAILVELAQLPHPPRSLVVTLQEEVVGRLRAAPASREYGVLTLLTRRVYSPGPSFRIPATCFHPPPDVTSACARLERRAAPLAAGDDARAYDTLVKTAFSQRRKQLRKVLRAAWPEDRVAAAWAALQLPDNIRAETLAPEVFAQMARILGAANRD